MHLFKKLLQILARPFIWFKHTRKRNKFITVILLIIAISIIGGQIAQLTAKPPYETQKASVDNVIQYVSETGNVNAGGSVEVYSSATGIIEGLYVKNGDDVSVNQPLFAVRSTATEEEKASAYASYQSAYSTQKKAEQAMLSADAAMWNAQNARLTAREKKRMKDNNLQDYEDLEERAVDAAEVQAEKDFTAAEKIYKESDVAVTAAKAAVTSAWLAYQDTINAVIKAPASGTIANLSFNRNDNVKSNASALSAQAGVAAATGGSPVLAIVNPSSEYTVKLALNEVDIPKVKAGQKATIALDAFSGEKYNGTVTHVDSVGTNVQGVVTYNVIVLLDTPKSNIKPGMTADVDIEVDKATNVLTVPNSAVKPYKGGRAVRVIDPKTKELKYIPVEIGIRGESKTQIVKGISEGEEIVTALSNEQVKKSGDLF